MNTKQVLLEVIDCAFDKQSWHGANLMSALRGVSAADAAKSVAGRKSIWQQLLHAAYWKHAMLNKLSGKSPFGRRGSNWPKIAEKSQSAWKSDLDFLREEHGRLRKAIAALPTRKLDAKTVWRIHGVAAHDLYHAGQIKLLRRLVRG